MSRSTCVFSPTISRRTFFPSVRARSRAHAQNARRPRRTVACGIATLRDTTDAKDSPNGGRTCPGPPSGQSESRGMDVDLFDRFPASDRPRVPETSRVSRESRRWCNDSIRSVTNRFRRFIESAKGWSQRDSTKILAKPTEAVQISAVSRNLRGRTLALAITRAQFSCRSDLISADSVPEAAGGLDAVFASVILTVAARKSAMRVAFSVPQLS